METETRLMDNGLATWRVGRAFETVRSTSRMTGGQVRRALLDRPALVLPRVTLEDKSLTLTEAAWMEAVSLPEQEEPVNIHGARNTARRSEVVGPDVALTVGDAAAGEVLLPCDASMRRFVAGGRARVWMPGRQTAAAVWRDVGVVSADAAGVVVDAALDVDWPAGTRVAPLVEVEPLVEAGGRAGSGAATGAWRSTARVGVGLPAAVVEPGSTPGGFEVFEGVPVLSDWLTPTTAGAAGVDRGGAVEAVGRTVVPDLDGPRGRRTARLTLAGATRERCWELLGFFDSRAGGCFWFWWVDYEAPVRVIEPRVVSVASGEVVARVAARGPVEQWGPDSTGGWRAALAVRDGQGDWEFARVVSAQRVGEVDELVCDPPLTAGAGDRAFVMRRAVGADGIEERWVKPGVMSFAWDVTEVGDQDAAPLDVFPTVSTALDVKSVPGNCGVSSPAPESCPLSGITAGGPMFAYAADLVTPVTSLTLTEFESENAPGLVPGVYPNLHPTVAAFDLIETTSMNPSTNVLDNRNGACEFRQFTTGGHRFWAASQNFFPLSCCSGPLLSFSEHLGWLLRLAVLWRFASEDNFDQVEVFLNKPTGDTPAGLYRSLAVGAIFDGGDPRGTPVVRQHWNLDAAIRLTEV